MIWYDVCIFCIFSTSRVSCNIIVVYVMWEISEVFPLHFLGKAKAEGKESHHEEMKTFVPFILSFHFFPSVKLTSIIWRYIHSYGHALTRNMCLFSKILFYEVHMPLSSSSTNWLFEDFYIVIRTTAALSPNKFSWYSSSSVLSPAEHFFLFQTLQVAVLSWAIVPPLIFPLI